MAPEKDRTNLISKGETCTFVMRLTGARLRASTHAHLSLPGTWEKLFFKGIAKMAACPGTREMPRAGFLTLWLYCNLLSSIKWEKIEKTTIIFQVYCRVSGLQQEWHFGLHNFFLRRGCCPVHCRMFSGISGPYPRRASTSNQSVPRPCQLPPARQDRPQMRTTGLLRGVSSQYL